MTPQEIKEIVCKALSEKKGNDITILHVEEMTVLADYFIICSARSAPQVKALGENVDQKMSEQGIEPLRREGFSDARWIVLDYDSVIVHIFNDDMRVIYALEQLWADGKNIEKYTL